MKAHIITADPNWSLQNWTDKKNGAAAAHYALSPFEYLESLKPTVASLADPTGSILGVWGIWSKLDECIDLLRSWDYKYVTGIPWIKVVPSSGRIRRGVGFWQQAASEFMLIGRKGKIKAKPLDSNVMGLMCGDSKNSAMFYDRLFDGKTTQHEEFFAEMWEHQFGDLDYFENWEKFFEEFGIPCGSVVSLFHKIGQHSRKPYTIAEYFEERFDGPYVELFATEPRDGWNCYGHKVGTHIDPDGIMTLEEAKQLGKLPEDYDPWAPPPKRKKIENAGA